MKALVIAVACALIGVVVYCLYLSAYAITELIYSLRERRKR